MKILLNVVVYELEKNINRQIIVDENMNLVDFCESVIVSMNGTKIPIYLLENQNILYYPYEIITNENERTMLNLTLKDLKLKKENEFYIDYNFEDNKYEFDLIVDDILDKGPTNSDKCFEVLSGAGYGILDDMHIYELQYMLTHRNENDRLRYKKSALEYLKKRFEVIEINNKVIEYLENKKVLHEPKSYIINVSLEGFNKEIKRKVKVNNDILIESFCRKIITSMNGDLSHCFSIKRNKDYLNQIYNKVELFYLDLKEKQRFKIFYDYGDDWEFNLTLSKISYDYNDKIEFEVLSGKGYGIIDDCGGVWGLGDIFSGEDTDWGEYDINDFDLDECNENVKKV